ncbi:Sodium hydrogen exchanger [Globodera pallida]|nr:Sodium hydrogen exchanger [Globodera pallida]
MYVHVHRYAYYFLPMLKNGWHTLMEIEVDGIYVPVNPINSSQAHIWSFGSDHHLHFPVVRPKSNEFLEWSLSANSDIDENEFCGEAADDEWLEGKAEFAGWLMLKAAERGIKLSRDFDETNFNPRFAGGDVSNCAEANFNMAYRVFELTSLEQLIRSQHKAQIRRPLILDAFEQSPQHKESFMRMFRGSDHSPSPPPTFAPRRKGSAASTFSSLAAGKASIVREDTDKTSQKAFGGEADDAEEETETDALTVAASDLPEGSGFTVLTTDERLSGKSTVAIATREAAEVAMAVVVGEDLDAGDAYSDLLVLEDRNGTAERMKDPLMKFESLLNRNKTSGMELSSNAPKSRRFGISSGLKSPNEVYFSNSVSCPLFPISKADLALYARYASASTSVFEHHNLLRQRKPTVWKLPTPLSRIRKPNARDNSSSPTHRLSFRQKKGEEEQPKQKASSIKRILPSMGRMPPQSPFRKDFSKLGPMFQFKPPLFTVDSTYETELSALSEESIRLYRETVEMRTIMTAKKPLLAAERTDHFDNGLMDFDGGIPSTSTSSIVPTPSTPPSRHRLRLPVASVQSSSISTEFSPSPSPSRLVPPHRPLWRDVGSKWKSYRTSKHNCPLTPLAILFAFILPMFLLPVNCLNSSNSSPTAASAASPNPAGSAPNISLFELLVNPTQTGQWNRSSANAVPSPFLRFRLFSLNWQHIATPFGVSLWLLLASIAKIMFNMKKGISEAVPDSALLIVLGLVLGWVLRMLDVDGEVFTLEAQTFFLYLLPPIIFDAGYFMPNRQLFDNYDSVLLFALVGTVWNTMAIGFSLLWLGHLSLFSIPFSAFQILLFASLISAVDPVAVIAVFEQIHINEFLFINVFGEALFNDGVSVVLYQMFRKFIAIGEPNLETMDYVAGIGSFLVIAIGGVLIGVFFSLITCIATKFTTRVRILAPVFVFIVPYMAYLSAELFGLSSILAIVACGISMKQYVKGNLSHDASNSVKYFVKMLAQCSETVIFMFLGLSAVSKTHLWDWVFVGATIGFCLLYRVIGVVVQCALLNRFRTKKGAIAFGLVVSLDDSLPPKQMFVTTCISVIFFTVFFQGITIRPLLHWLKVKKNDLDKEGTVFEKLCSRNCDYLMAGIEDIVGLKGRNSIRETFERFNANVLKPALMRGEQHKPYDASPIIRAYNKLTLLEAQRLVRASLRKTQRNVPIGHRVGPAPSPSSATSTLTYFQWTTEGRDPPKGEKQQTTPEGVTVHNQLQPRNAKPGQPGSADALFEIFTRLMDEGADLGTSAEKLEEDDIKDNYMDTIMSNTDGQPNRERPNPTTGTEPRRRRSLSPELERQMCCSSPSVVARAETRLDQFTLKQLKCNQQNGTRSPVEETKAI